MLLKPGVATKALAAKKKKAPPPVPTAVAPTVPNAPPVPIENTPLTAQGIWDAYNKKQAEANSANLGRYNEILADLNERYKRNMGYLEGMGASEASDINDAAMQQAANVQQQMTSAGLAGTTVMPTLKAGVERDRLAEQGRLQERLRQQKIAADSQLSGDIAGFKERRTDQGPDLGLYAQLAMQMAAGGQGGTPTSGGAPGGGMPGGGTTGGGAPTGGPGLGGMMMSAPYVKETMPLYSNAAGGGSFTKNRPLTDHEKGVLAMGGMVPGYQKPHAYAPLMGGVSTSNPRGPTHTGRPTPGRYTGSIGSGPMLSAPKPAERPRPSMPTPMGPPKSLMNGATQITRWGNIQPAPTNAVRPPSLPQNLPDSPPPNMNVASRTPGQPMMAPQAPPLPSQWSAVAEYMRRPGVSVGDAIPPPGYAPARPAGIHGTGDSSWLQTQWLNAERGVPSTRMGYPPGFEDEIFKKFYNSDVGEAYGARRRLTR